jgi:hypothetical protein
MNKQIAITNKNTVTIRETYDIFEDVVEILVYIDKIQIMRFYSPTQMCVNIFELVQ